MPTRFPNGLTTTSKTSPFGEFILPDETKAYVFHEDFNYYNASDWTVTEVGVATQALTSSEEFGVLLITNASSDDDSSFQQKVGESFLFATGRKTWFESRLRVSDATQSDWVVGLQITDTSPLSVSHGVYFRKDDGSTNIHAVVRSNEVESEIASLAINADNTHIKLSFFYDGVDTVFFYVDGVFAGSLPTTNLPLTELTISFGVQNGEAVAKTMSVDYIMAAKER